MNVKQFIGGIKKLRPTPKLLPELRRLLKNSESSMDEIIDLIRVENALSSQVIRASNTPFYGATTPSQNVEEAIKRIGFHEVYKLVAMLIASQTLNKRNDVYNVKGDVIFVGSVKCGFLMQAVAKEIKGDHDNAYTIGIMHLIGKTAVNAYYQDSRDEVPSFSDDDDDLIKKEYKELGFNHAEAGGALLSQWKFSDEITEPIAWQYKPDSAGDYKPMAYALGASKKMAANFEMEPQEAFENSGVTDEDLDAIGIYEDDFIDSFIDAKALMKEMKELIK